MTEEQGPDDLADDTQVDSDRGATGDRYDSREKGESLLTTLQRRIEAEFPGLVVTTWHTDEYRWADAVLVFTPHNPLSGEVLVIYSNGSFYVAVAQWRSADSDDHPSEPSKFEWAVQEVEKIARYGVAQISYWGIPLVKSLVVPASPTDIDGLKRKRTLHILHWSAPWGTATADAFMT